MIFAYFQFMVLNMHLVHMSMHQQGYLKESQENVKDSDLGRQ